MSQEIVLDDKDRALLREILVAYVRRTALPEARKFRVEHRNERGRLDRLQQAGLLLQSQASRYTLTIDGLQASKSGEARDIYEKCRGLLSAMQGAYAAQPSASWTPVEQIVQHHSYRWVMGDAPVIATLLMSVGGVSVQLLDSGLVHQVSLKEQILDASIPDWPDDPPPVEDLLDGDAEPRIANIEISGYRPFAGFSASPGPLTVIIGANAAGKSSLFDVLRLLWFAAQSPLPAEIDPRNAGTTLFHAGGPQRLDLALTVSLGLKKPVRYEVSIHGPVGSPRVARERLATTEPLREKDGAPFVLLDFTAGKGTVRDPRDRGQQRPEWSVAPNELALRRALDPTLVTLAALQGFFASFRFYSGFDVSPTATLRRPVHIEESPILAEDGSNLSAVLNALYLEQRASWDELETHLRSVIPGFESLGVKPRGGKGMAIGVWRERGVQEELTLADLSDGTLRLLCWLALAVSPTLPPLICLDEPEIGLHPRVLPTLAGALRLASARSQILIATHSPHFLSQFTLEDIAVMRKEDGRAVFVRPATSEALRSEVAEIGGEAIARLFLSEELEVLP